MDMILLTYFFLLIMNRYIPFQPVCLWLLELIIIILGDFISFTDFRVFDTMILFYFKSTNEIGKTYSIIFGFLRRKLRLRRN